MNEEISISIRSVDALCEKWVWATSFSIYDARLVLGPGNREGVATGCEKTAEAAAQAALDAIPACCMQADQKLKTLHSQIGKIIQGI